MTGTISSELFSWEGEKIELRRKLSGEEGTE